MKKFKIIGLFLIFMACFVGEVHAAEIYKRGIIKTSSTVKYEARSNSSNMLSDTKSSMTLTSPEAVEIVGESGDWYQIKFMWTGFVYVGYVPKANVIAKEYVIDENYRQELLNQGFPIDYAKKLAILHAIHPNWTFKPSFTGGEARGLDFYTAVKGEARYVSTNAIQTSNTSLLSTADGAYKNGVWLDVAGYNWKAASEQTIAFYMDPRNFLDESHIFMFENLAYNANAKNREAVLNLVKGTFMDSTFECFNGANNCVVGSHTFVDTFLETGAARSVSPAHLASRVKAEQGNSGSTLSLGKGFDKILGPDGNPMYRGLYNFFNIGASGATDYDIILNGFKYAERENWNNQYVSIYAGSKLISNNYIGRGQSTRYYQKFNTITPTYYINQYMQNVRAPYTEAYSTYTSNYKTYATMDDWDAAAYDFLIPIYQNMGTLTSLDSAFNSDATLQSLEISNCKMNPEFSSSAYSYDCYTLKENKELTVEARATNGNAKLDYPTKVSLTSDEQTIEIKVTAVNGTPATYTIKVHRIEKDTTSPDDILNKVGYKVNGEYVSNIECRQLGVDENNTECTPDVSNIVSSITNTYHFADVKILDENGTKITSGATKTGQKITLTNAEVTKTYNIIIFGDVNKDAKIDLLDLLALQKYILKAKTFDEVQKVAVDVNRDNKIDILDLLTLQKYILRDGTINQG